ncbi:Mobile element protein [Helicobacter heilmannii]|nr:Mobile element protein [Helicobacter heilmannii]
MIVAWKPATIQYKSNNNIVYSCKYHIVWCPKYRRKVLVDQVEIRLKQIILEVAQELEVEILAMETDKGHIHILAEVDPSFTKETPLCSFWSDEVY